MIDFKDELQKYKPVLEVNEVEKAIRSDESQDMLELLQYLRKHIAPDVNKSEER